MNIEVNFALPPWSIALLQKPFHTSNSNYTWWGCFIPPPPMVLLRYNRRSSIPVSTLKSSSALLNPLGALQSKLVLWYFIQLSLLTFLSVLLLEDGRSSIPSSTSIRSRSISFQTPYLPHLAAMLTLDGLLHCKGAPQSLSALHGLDLRPSIRFCTPPSPSALPLPTSRTTSGTPPFLVAHLFFPRIHHIAFQSPIWFTAT